MPFMNIRTLEDNELPGCGVYNPLATAIRNMRSASDNLDVFMGNDGGLRIDFRPPLEWLDLEGGGIHASFGGTLEKKNGSRKLTVNGGEVNWPNMAISNVVDGITVNNAGSGLKVWCHITSSGATLQSGNSFPSWLVSNIGASSSSFVLNVKMLELVTVKKRLAIKYHHVGDVNFSSMPYFWIPGYDAAKKQSLDHAEGTGLLVWTDYGECDEEEQ